MHNIIHLDHEGFSPGVWGLSPGDDPHPIYIPSEEEIEILSGTVVLDKDGERTYRVAKEGFPADYVRVYFSTDRKAGIMEPLFQSVRYLDHYEIEELLFNELTIRDHMPTNDTQSQP